MQTVYAIVNQKGGVGKTTTTINLGAALARQDKRVLLVDLDPQGNTTSGLGIDKDSLERCIYDCLVKGATTEEVKLTSGIPGVTLLPATLKLADAEVDMVSQKQRETLLRRALAPIRNDYDIVLIDCPPSMGLLTINTLAAADAVIIPMQCEFYALEGVSSLIKIINLVRMQLNPTLRICGVLATMYDPRMNVTEQVMKELRSYFGPKLFTTTIPRNVRLSEAPSHGQSVLDYDPRCRGAAAYIKLAEEVLERG